MSAMEDRPAILDQQPSLNTFREDVLAGLRRDEKRLQCKYFYDERGSALFEQICELEEYYLTRTELAIMRQFADEMAASLGEGLMLVEYGSGSSLKTRLLLERLPDPAAYVPVDISREHLAASARELSQSYPHVEVLPVCADFTQNFDLPSSTSDPERAVVYFPGSTIGNFDPPAAQRLLGGIAEMCGRGGGLLIGIDLQKDVGVLESAYNDEEGVTAEFNLNLLRRINDELDANFELEQFVHSAVYQCGPGRIEIHLQSQVEQTVTINDEAFEFAEGELIHTENSHKYTIDGFAAMAAEVGLTLHQSWTDDEQMFGVLYLVTEE